MSRKISEFISDDRQKTAMVINRTQGGFRLVLLDSYFETQQEFFYNGLLEAEIHAEEWVSNK